MSVTPEQFASYMGEHYETSSRQADIVRCLSAGRALVDTECLYAWRPVPDEVKDQATLMAASNLYRRAENNNGQFADAPLRAPVDPMLDVRPLLRKWVMSA